MISRFSETACIALWLAAAIMFTCMTAAKADTNKTDAANPEVLFLTVSNSPRANGMGGCMLNVVDEQSPFYNPGALGLFHSEKIFSLSFPHTTDWLPNLALDMGYKTFNISGGASTRLFMQRQRPHLSLGVAYGTQKIDYGEIEVTDASGNSLGVFNPWEEAKYYSMGIGLEYYARLGIGISKKEIVSRLANIGIGDGLLTGAEADAIDFGLLVEVPAADLIAGRSDSGVSKSSDYGFALTPSFAYVSSNNGDDIKYIDAAEADPLPELRKIGIGLYGDVTYKGVSIASLRAIWESHQWQIGTRGKISQRGAELGVLDAFFLRFGTHSDDGGSTSYDTFGFGFSLHGFLGLLSLSQIKPDNELLDHILSHVDFTIDYASYSGDDTPLDETTFTSLCISF